MGAGRGKTRRASSASLKSNGFVIPTPEELHAGDDWVEVEIDDLESFALGPALASRGLVERVRERIKPGMIVLRSSPTAGVVLSVEDDGDLWLRFADGRHMTMRWGRESFAVFAPARQSNVFDNVPDDELRRLEF